MSNAKLDARKESGFDRINNQPSKNGRLDFRHEQQLTSKHATVTLVFEFTAYVSDEGYITHVSRTEYDDDGSRLPPISVKITKPDLQHEHILSLYDDGAIWVVISLLRGDTRFIAQNEQLWAFVPEHNVWVVQYKAKSSYYGLRSDFKQTIARKYWFDK